MSLVLYNTLTRKKEPFTPLDAQNVRMYVCGPTVYGRAHLGNARSVVVYDVLYRLLRQIYGPKHVTYVRNITDVDDKINAAAKARNVTIGELTKEVTGWFHSDMGALGVLPATDNKHDGLMLEPKATDHIAQMIRMIERLIDNGCAYFAQNHVLFSVESQPQGQAPGYRYGQLSGRIQAELEAGARVKVESYKRAPGDFVLWKPAGRDDDPSSVFDSPWGNGRPGWHIECSAMSVEYLGADFDIHGGGADLMFPHHENEIAQSCGAYPGSHFARVWVHNGFLTVDGEKMSKSLGNFITVKDLLDKGVKGEAIRYALLSTGYNKPLDWNAKLLADAQKSLDYLYRAMENFQKTDNTAAPEAQAAFLSSLSDDLNLPYALSLVTETAGKILGESDPVKKKERQQDLRFFGSLLGLLGHSPLQWFKSGMNHTDPQSMIDARSAAKKAKNWAEADRIRVQLKEQGIMLEDKPDGTTDWRRQ